MKLSFCILLFTGACAIAAMLLAWLLGGHQEDVACALGGAAGFVLANASASRFRRTAINVESHNESPPESAIPELGFAYGVFALAYFSFLGWLTGYVHNHGEFAGTVCGALGGFILAVIVPALHRSPFMATGRKLQLAISVVALCMLLTIVWAMYKHELIA